MALRARQANTRSAFASFLAAALISAVGYSCASGAVPGAAGSAGGAWNGGTVASTQFGLVQGKKDSHDTLAWLGIPYAAPPVGTLRWMPPEDPEPWSGVKKTVSYGSKAVQPFPLVGWTVGSEDSLYLNVWRPDSAETGLPVFVWIHGGGNSTGSANASAFYEGRNLAARADAVFVSVNYRLGIFGWFAHPALLGGDGSPSGNFGTMDLIKALSWIRDNIEEFGGDPGRVTIAGESAGAYNVMTLLVAPAAKGLFRSAIAESAYRTAATPETAKAFAEDLAAALLAKRRKTSIVAAEAELAAMDRSETAELLRAASPKELMSLIPAQRSGMLSFPYPIWDGAVLPEDGFAALSDPSRSAEASLIIGTNKEETKIFQWLSRQDWKDPLYQAQAEAAAARWKADGADSLADEYASASASRRVYVYRFDWGALRNDGSGVLPGNASRRYGAYHSLEIPFFLQSMQEGPFVLGGAFSRANEPGRLALSDAVGRYVVSLVRTGSPNAASANSGQSMDAAALPWPEWNPQEEKPSFLVLDADLRDLAVRVENGRTTRDTLREMIDAYDEPLRSRLIKALAE